MISEVYKGFTEKIHVLHPPEPNVGRVLPDLLHLGELHHPVDVLVLGEAVPGPLLPPPHLVSGPVLLHDVDVDVGRDGVEPRHDLLPLLQEPRHDEVPHQHPGLGQPVVIKDQVTNLTVHFRDDLPGHLGIVPGLTQPGARLSCPEFEVRHVDVHQTVQQLQRPQTVVAAGVVHDGEVEAALDGQGDGLDDLGYDVFRGDEVDVVTFRLVLKFQHKVSNLGSLQLPAFLLLRDVPVLTEDTPEVAQPEEDGARAVPALEDGLLPEVREGGADDGLPAGVAGALLVLQPVDFTEPGADLALLQLSHGLRHLLLQPALPGRPEGAGLVVAHQEGRSQVQLASGHFLGGKCTARPGNGKV